MFYDDLDLEFVAKTIYGEARGEFNKGKQAVGYVICNRAKIAKRYVEQYGHGHPLYGSGTPASACTVAYQFSCWNIGDENLPIITNLDIHSTKALPSLGAAKVALEETLPDPSNGATHYHALGINPDWAEGQIPCASIGNHVFYNLG